MSRRHSRWRPVAFGAIAVFFVANWALVYVGIRCLLTH